MRTFQFAFSRNFIRHAMKNWRDHLAPLREKPLTYLEIGVFEGRSGCWMLSNVLVHPASRYIGIDNWTYSRKHQPAIIEERARANLSHFHQKVSLYRGDSAELLRRGPFENGSIDIGYIDGDHAAAGCLQDSILLWPLIKIGGLLIWDDYDHRRPRGHVMEAVDSFLSCFSGRYEFLFQNRQIGVRKTR